MSSQSSHHIQQYATLISHNKAKQQIVDLPFSFVWDDREGDH